jgi:isopenicillin-N epimerase
VFVVNATSGVNAVLRSLSWSAGDEILLADMTYNAVKQTGNYIADTTGATVVQATIPFPITDPAEIVAAFAAAITPRTRLMIVDHVVSPTALVCPVAELIALARDRGVAILVDGAHAPGMLPVDIDTLQPDFYTGNLHKWAYAAKGSAILWVAPRWRSRIHPSTISHFYGGGLRAEFDFVGTIDPSAWLSVPDALDFYESLPGMVDKAHAMVRRGRVQIAEALGTPLPHPDDRLFYVTLAAIEVPAPSDGLDPFARTAKLFDEHHIEVPYMSYDRRLWIRISANAYNAPEDYTRLAEVLTR